MSCILTTVYPSVDGDGAAQYAAALAAAMGLPLRLVFPYTVPVAYGEIPMPLISVEDAQDAAGKRLDQASGAIAARFPALQLKSDLAYGTLADVIEEAGEKDQPLLVIIGNDDGAEAEAWLSNDSADILREGKWPALAVPAGTAFRTPQHVCIACDSRGIREGLWLQALGRLREALGFKITVLHMLSGDEEGQVVFEESALARQLAGMAAGYTEVSAGKPVDEAIAEFADTHNIDWLAMAPHQYGFWQGLFHKSHTSRVLHLAHVPVLALHGEGAGA